VCVCGCVWVCVCVYVCIFFPSESPQPKPFVRFGRTIPQNMRTGPRKCPLASVFFIYLSILGPFTPKKPKKCTPSSGIPAKTKKFKRLEIDQKCQCTMNKIWGRPFRICCQISHQTPSNGGIAMTSFTSLKKPWCKGYRSGMWKGPLFTGFNY
jgi:hypothetical protein